MDTSHAAVVAKQPDRAWRCGWEPGTWAACGGSPHAACPALTQRWRASDTPPLPSSKTRPWALVSLTVRVRPLKGLISPKEPSQMSPGITDPLSPCSSVRRCFHPSAHHSLPTLRREDWAFLGGKGWVSFTVFSKEPLCSGTLWVTAT